MMEVNMVAEKCEQEEISDKQVKEIQDIMHEIKNNLAVIQTSVEFSETSSPQDKEEAKKTNRRLLKQTKEATKKLNKLSSLLLENNRESVNEN